MKVIQITDRLVIPVRDEPINEPKTSWFDDFSDRWVLVTQRLQESGHDLTRIKITNKKE